MMKPPTLPAPPTRRTPSRAPTGGEAGAPLQQDRARRTYEALITAAAELFERHGFDATGSPEIARQAGTAVGTFYWYFTDKQTILLEVLQRHFDALMHAGLDRLSPTELAGKGRTEAMGLAVDALFAAVAARPGLWRTMEELRLRDPAVADIRNRFHAAGQQRMALMVRLITSPDDVADPEAVAWLVHAAAVECAAAVAGLRSNDSPGRERLRATLILFIERTLFPRG
jgi:AcrR family transcriptional regulator